ncbi:hypothetical protein IK112_02360 [Candidatus Saccharibacteria bacterium]|nr:hypothetical protein [Candidatus Saccharibacteria bacterium]
MNRIRSGSWHDSGFLTAGLGKRKCHTLINVRNIHFLFPNLLKIKQSETTVHATRFSFYSTGARRYPLSYVWPGYYFWNTGTAYEQNGNGVWWSNTSRDNETAYVLNVQGASALIPQYYSNRNAGFSLRCIARWSTYF